MSAVFCKNIKHIQTFILDGADLNERGRRKVTLLHEAAVNTGMFFWGLKGLPAWKRASYLLLMVRRLMHRTKTD